MRFKNNPLKETDKWKVFLFILFFPSFPYIIQFTENENILCISWYWHKNNEQPIIIHVSFSVIKVMVKAIKENLAENGYKQYLSKNYNPDTVLYRRTPKKIILSRTYKIKILRIYKVGWLMLLREWSKSLHNWNSEHTIKLLLVCFVIIPDYGLLLNYTK